MLGASALMFFETLEHNTRLDEEAFVCLLATATLAAGSFGITAKSLTVVTLSRASAWVFAAPMAVYVVVQWFGGFSLSHLSPQLAFASLTTTALVAARPALDTPEARAQFNPVRLRRTLLAGATASAAVGLLTLALGIAELFSRSRQTLGGVLAVVALLLLASSTAMTRMRTWGVFLGGGAWLGLIITAALSEPDIAFLLFILAAPMFVLQAGPILWAHARRSRLRVHETVVPRENELDAAVDADGEHLPEKRRQVHV